MTAIAAVLLVVGSWLLIWFLIWLDRQPSRPWYYEAFERHYREIQEQEFAEAMDREQIRLRAQEARARFRIVHVENGR